MRAIRALLAEFRSGTGLKGQLLRGGFWSLIIKLMSTLMALVLAVVLARVLGAEGFGVYSFVLALVTILAIPAQMGLPDLVIRETAKAQVAERWDIIKMLWRWSSFMALGMSLVLMLLGGLVAWLFAYQLGETQVQTLWWGLLLVPIVALGNLRGAALRGLRKVVQGQLPEFVLRPLFLVALLLVTAIGWGLTFGPAEAMILHVIAALGAFIIGAWLLLRVGAPEARPASQSTPHPRAWLAAAVPLGLIGGMQLISANVGLIALGLFHESKYVADFRVGMQGSLLVTLGLYAANQMASPHFARFYAQQDKAQLQGAATQTAIFAVSLALPIFIVLSIWGELFITIAFGQEFRSAIVPLIILAAGQLFNASVASVALLLSMTDHAKTSAYISLCTMLLNIALTLALVPSFGPVGAAVSSVLTVIAHTFALRVVVRNKLGIEPSILSLLKFSKRGA